MMNPFHPSSREVSICFALLLTLSSCSSIINGSKQKMMVNSEPSDAEIMLNGSFAGRTPAQLELQRGKSYMFEIKKEGYITARVTTDKSMDPIFFLNIFVWPGFIVDVATGSAWRFDPEIINLSLDKMSGN